MTTMSQSVFPTFKRCVEAIREGVFIKRVSASDKEFHFQNWFENRLKGTEFHYEIGGRNSYPDFRIVSLAEGYEIKGLAYPGRDASFDSNSQVPTGFHNGRSIYYVFGRYPKNPDGNEYPVLDLVISLGELTRIEAAELIVGYSFDLQTNEILPKKSAKPGCRNKTYFSRLEIKGIANNARKNTRTPIRCYP